jgi:hypothetical protein
MKRILSWPFFASPCAVARERSYCRKKVHELFSSCRDPRAIVSPLLFEIRGTWYLHINLPSCGLAAFVDIALNNTEYLDLAATVVLARQSMCDEQLINFVSTLRAQMSALPNPIAVMNTAFLVWAQMSVGRSFLQVGIEAARL